MTSKSNDLGPATEGRKGRGDRRQAGRAASASRSESEAKARIAVEEKKTALGSL